MRKYFIIIASILLPLMAFGQYRSEKNAISVAQSFWGSSQTNLKVVSQSAINKAKARASSKPSQSTDKHAYYVINDEAKNRFVIVSGDERLYTILGYSDNGIFDAETAPYGLLDMLSDYDNQYISISAGLDKIPAQARVRAAAAPVTPLLTTKWDQSSPYNDDCPADVTSSEGENCATGCVATAMTQVMNYYKYPLCGQGSNSYISAKRYIYQSMDFSSVYPDWSNMIDVYDNNATPTQNDAVAKLMHACGVAVSMDYATSSGAYAIDMAYALSHFWKYSPEVSYKLKRYYSDNDWTQIINSELADGHPILYAGSGDSGGHQFVLDGCDEEGLYHFNFGWSGHGDGYFSLSLLAPVYDFLGVIQIPLGDYTSGQEMVCYLRPNSEGAAKGEFYAKEGLGLSETSVGNSKLVSGTIYNVSTVSARNISSAPKFEGKLGVGVFDRDFNFIKSLSEKNVTLGGGNGTTLYGWLQFDASTFSNGKSYYIAYYAYSPELGYSIARTEHGLEDYYLATVNGDKITFQPMAEMGQDTPPAVCEVVTGLYNATATLNGESISWQINLWQDSQDADKYWIANLDPLAKRQGYSYEQGWNKVYGYVSAQGSKIDIPVDQAVGPNLLLRNYSGGDNVTLYLSEKDKTMSIDDVWGSVEQSYASGNSTVMEFSKYTGTNFVYTTVKDDDEQPIVPAPVISVSSEHMLTIICEDKDAKIYYNLDGPNPSASSCLYTSPIELTGNCTIKAIAIKNNVSSDIASYTVSDFVCATPEITQGANSNRIEISCATPGVKIYYTTDDTTPSIYSAVYTAAFEITKSTVVKAVAVKDNYKQSALASKSVIYYQPDTPDPGNNGVVKVTSTAGNLSSLVSDTDKSTATRWIISGEINGTDIKYLREVFEYKKITDLDLGNAVIVSGGDPYYSSVTGGYSTEDNVVGHMMFTNAKSLISLILPETATKLKMYSIQNCDNLASIIIPSHCETVEDHAITSCAHIAEIRIGKDTKYFGAGNGNSCKALSQITVDPQNGYLKSADGVLFDKNQTKLYKYPAAKEGTTYNVPSTVEAIEDYAFKDALLESVSLPEGLKEIQTGAFDGCRMLNRIAIPDKVRLIGMFAFQNCASLTSVSIPDNVEELKSFAFGYCSWLRTCHLGSSLKEIDGSAFSGSVSLQAFTVSEDNSHYAVNDGILYSKDMSRLVRCPLAYYSDELLLNDDIKEIESDAFASCTGIGKFKLPEGIRKIGSAAFSGCLMEEIKIPNSVEEIGMFAFQDCVNLQSFAVPAALNSIPTFMLAGCQSLNYLYLAKGVKEIDSYAFTRCKNLTTIESWIEDFTGVNMDTDYYGGYSQFDGIPGNCTWHVPVGCAQKYKSQPWWVATWTVIDDMSAGILSAVQDGRIGIRVTSGSIIFESAADTSVDIFDIKGRMVRRISISAGGSETVSLPAGVYLIDGKKIFVK